MTTFAQNQQAERERDDKEQRQLLRDAAKLLKREPHLTMEERAKLDELAKRIAMVDGFTLLRSIAKIMRSGLSVF